MRSTPESSCARGATFAGRSGMAIPRLVPPDLVRVEQREPRPRSAGSGSTSSEMHPEFEAQFLDWVHPLGARVLPRASECSTPAAAPAGMPTSRPRTAPARSSRSTSAGPSRRARARTSRQFENVEVVQGDLLRPPFRTAAAGWRLRPRLLDRRAAPSPRSVRRVQVAASVRTSRAARSRSGSMATRITASSATWSSHFAVCRRSSPLRSCAGLPGRSRVGFHGAAKGVYRPLRKNRQPMHCRSSEYMTSVADFSFRQNYAIVFDQLAAPTAAYIKGPELEGWFSANAARGHRITHRHETPGAVADGCRSPRPRSVNSTEANAEPARKLARVALVLASLDEYESQSGLRSRDS